MSNHLSPSSSTPRSAATPLPLVVIAASAGGLDPISEILADYPSDLDVATIVIQHLSPAYRSELVNLLQSHTKQQVHELHDGMQLQAHNIYVIQPGTQITLQGDTVKTISRNESERPYFTIDVFLESVTRRGHPVGTCVVLLSGTGSDGTAGCRAVHDQGGYVLVQQLADAKFDGMPLSVINSGSYDEVQPARLIPARIIAWLDNGMRKPSAPAGHREADPLALLYSGNDSPPASDINPYAGIFELMQASFDLDLNAYKIGTIDRRVTQRMRRLGLTTIDQYCKLLAQGGHELRALFTDLLVGVTSFFRNPQVFELLESKVLPDLLERNSTTPLKIWVCACSTGEEAYSVAMLLQKLVQRMDAPVEFRIYATDLNPDAIRRASEGIYEYSTLQPFISRFDLQQFVSTSEDFGRLRVTNEIRRKIIFSVQNVLKHSPLHALDLVFCRNMLIYLRPEAQRKVISNFHFGLKEHGILVLGESEGPSGLEPYFAEVDARLKIFNKRVGIGLSANDRWQLNRSIAMVPLTRPMTQPRDTQAASIPRGAFEAAFSAVAGNSLIIRADGEVQYVTGHCGEIFNRSVPGRPALNLHTHLPTPELQALLQLGLAEALDSPEPFQWIYPYRDEGNKLEFDQLRFSRLPSAFDRQSSVLVQMLTDASRSDRPETSTTRHAHDVLAALQSGSGGLGRLARLEQENAQLRQIVSESVQDRETFHEELQSANEELLSSNEELQSTNEELQSVNEELHSVNAELEEKIRQLTEANSDITNLLTSTDVALIFLDENLRIRRFTEAARNHFPLGMQDIGRPIEDLSTNLAGLDIPTLGRSVLANAGIQRHDVHLRDQQWLQVVFFPYYDHEGLVRGVVMTVYDISHTRHLLQVERQSRLHRELVQGVLSIGYLEIADIHGDALQLDDNLRQLFGLTAGQTIGLGELLLRIHEQDRAHARSMLTAPLADNQRQSVELRLRDSHGKFHWMLCNIASNPSSADGTGVIAMLLDVDSRKRADIQSHEQEISSIHANRIFNIGMLVSGVAHELNNPLSALRLGNEQLQLQAAATPIDGSRIARIARAQADAVTRMDQIISSLLRFARKDEDTSLKVVHVATLVQDTVQLTRAMANENNVDVTHDAVPDQLTLLGHPLELAQALVNLVSNGIQHVASLPRPRWVHLQVEVKNGDYLFRVSDSGLSKAIEHPERLFTPFYTTKDVGHGTGLGLPLSQGIAEAHAGSLSLDSHSHNTCFVMKIPSRPGSEN